MTDMSTYVKRGGRYYNVNRKVEFETEFRETNQGLRVKARELGRKMRKARCVSVLTGAGISTSAGVRDMQLAFQPWSDVVQVRTRRCLQRNYSTVEAFNTNNAYMVNT